MPDDTRVPLLALSVPDVLTPAQCAEIRRAAMAAGFSRSLIATRDRGQVATGHRTSDEARLPRGEATEWLYARILAASADVAARHWRIATGGIEDIRVLRYRAFQRYRWHNDVKPGSARLLSCVVALSPPRTHWRGALELRAPHHGRDCAGRLGAGTWFPSAIWHRATPPWWGERWVLVTWLTGSPGEGAAA